MVFDHRGGGGGHHTDQFALYFRGYLLYFRGYLPSILEGILEGMSNISITNLQKCPLFSPKMPSICPLF